MQSILLHQTRVWSLKSRLLKSHALKRRLKSRCRHSSNYFTKPFKLNRLTVVRTVESIGMVCNVICHRQFQSKTDIVTITATPVTSSLVSPALYRLQLNLYNWTGLRSLQVEDTRPGIVRLCLLYFQFHQN